LIKLIEVTKKISEDADYTIDIKSNRNDEIGILTKSFNEMIKQIAARDTIRDQIENEINKTKDMLDGVINSMPSVLISIDENSVITHSNHAAEEFIGGSYSKTIGKNIWKLTNKLDRYKNRLESIITNNEIKVYLREKFNDDLNVFDVFLYPIVSASIRGIVIRIDDVTKFDKKEQQLRQSQKMETVGTLAGGLAHDFNNVLGGILGSISLIEFKMNRKTPIEEEILVKYLNIIKESSERARIMVKQLLTLSRKTELESVSVDLNVTVKNVMDICQNSFDKSIELKPEYFKDSAIIEADPTQLEQVILNLCVNASHAMTIMRGDTKNYGGKLYVSIEYIIGDHIFESTFPEALDEDYYLISIKDTGIGIEDEIKSKIFEPFFTTKSKENGSGLGLSMVYNIVKQHSGFLTIYSELNIGSTFNLYFPVGKRVKNLSNEMSSSPEIIQGEGLILVVDDEPIMRQMAGDILEECGYTTLFANNGEEAVEIFKENHNRITAVLLDMVMPKKSGKDAFILMKEIDSSLKVLLASGFKQDERTKSILELGVKDFLQKPYTISKLSKKIADVINL